MAYGTNDGATYDFLEPVGGDCFWVSERQLCLDGPNPLPMSSTALRRKSCLGAMLVSFVLCGG